MATSDAFYNALKIKVDTILAQFGTTFTIRSPGSYDADELEAVAGSTRSATGVVADQNFKHIIGAIATGEWIGKRMLILEADAAPQAGEEVQVDSEWYPLSQVNPIKPADVIVVYLLDVTR
jgi:hypothetical protein